MKVSDISFFCCLACQNELDLTVFANGEYANTVEEGVLSCKSCKYVYIITEGIPFLIDKCYYEDFDIKAFMKRWNSKFNFNNYIFFQGEINDNKMSQLVFFNADSKKYEDNVSNSAFWRATDKNVLGQWMNEIPKSCSVLDIGCGAGRCTIPLARSGRNVMGTDISIGMLRKAVIKAKDNGVGDVTFFLADAENLPLRSNIFTTVISYGMLHHVDEPTAILRIVNNILKDNGVFYALENHASRVRFIFDFLMKFNKLWDEEGGSYPIFKVKELEDMVKTSGLNPVIETRIFLPPHMFNLMGYTISTKILRISDCIFSRIPFIRDFGGQMVLKAIKN